MGGPGLSRALEPALACVGRLLLHLSQRRVCFLEKNTKLETQIRLLESLAHNFPSEFGTLATIVFKASSNIDATEHSKCWQVRRENLRGGEGMQRGFSSEFNGMRSEPAGYGLATTWKKNIASCDFLARADSGSRWEALQEGTLRGELRNWIWRSVEEGFEAP